MQANTFSIAARCARTGMLGVAVSTAVPAVGAMCPHVRAGVGAACTQAWVNPYLGFGAIEALAAGADADAALRQVIGGDDAAPLRQVGIVDARGGSASWSGEACTPWFGHRTGPGHAIQGNMLAGSEVVAAMEAAFLGSAAEELAERLVRALEAGQAAGGDKRGKQSAALLVHHQEDYPLVDLRVDEHAAPVAELRRIWGVFLQQTRPFLAGMPRRGAPAGPIPEEVTAMLLRPPAERPGGGGHRPELDRLRALLGIELPDAELDALLAAHAAIAAEIRTLHALDLTDTHPAVVFDPLLPYRGDAA